MKIWIWMSNCPGKAIWLWLLMALSPWDWSYLGTYDDVYGDKKALAIRDKLGKMVWKCIPEEIPGKHVLPLHRFLNDEVPLYRQMYMPWRDLAVRLGYIHIVDNLIHVIWLRYYLENGPYTPYINNSEILTLVLLVQTGIYTFARMRTHVTFIKITDDEEIGMELENRDLEVKIRQSWSEGLVSRSAHQNLPRRSTGMKYVRMFVCFVASTFLMVVFISKMEKESQHS
jgi:hypothetical protein